MSYYVNVALSYIKSFIVALFDVALLTVAQLNVALF